MSTVSQEIIDRDSDGKIYDGTKNERPVSRFSLILAKQKSDLARLDSEISEGNDAQVARLKAIDALRGAMKSIESEGYAKVAGIEDKSGYEYQVALNGAIETEEYRRLKSDLLSLKDACAKWNYRVAELESKKFQAIEGIKLAKIAANPNFEDWFGNSVTTGYDGLPLVIYHGTTEAGFDEFSGKNEHGDSATYGSDNIRIASGYSSGYQDDVTPIHAATIDDIPKDKVWRWYGNYEVGWHSFNDRAMFEAKRLNSTEPIRVQFELADTGYKSSSEENVVSAYNQEVKDRTPGGYGVYPLFFKIEKPLIVDCEGREWDNLVHDLGSSTREIEAKARKLGEYDGIIFKNIRDNGFADFTDEMADVYAVFDPTQIKSIHNAGTFDSSKNIMKSMTKSLSAKDGDGDGRIYDGTDQEQDATEQSDEEFSDTISDHIEWMQQPTAEEVQRVLEHFNMHPVEFMGETLPGVYSDGEYILQWDGGTGKDFYARVDTDKNDFVASYDISNLAEKYENQFNEDFWSGPPPLYHATEADNVEAIKEGGLESRAASRGMSNRNVGSSVYTTGNYEEALGGSYGDNIFEIDMAAMAKDGHKPFVSQEPDIVEHEVRMALANVMGAEDYYYDIEGGMSADTVVINSSIDPKYIKLVYGSMDKSLRFKPLIKRWLTKSKQRPTDDNGKPVSLAAILTASMDDGFADRLRAAVKTPAERRRLDAVILEAASIGSLRASTRPTSSLQKRFNPNQPRDDQGRWVRTELITAAALDVEVADRLRATVTDPDQRKLLDTAIVEASNPVSAVESLDDKLKRQKAVRAKIKQMLEESPDSEAEVIGTDDPVVQEVLENLEWSDQDLASVVGAPDDSTVHVEYSFDGSLEIHVYHDEIDSMVRFLKSTNGKNITSIRSASKVCVENDVFKVKGAADGSRSAPKGFGTSVFASQVANCARRGLSHIECMAGRNDAEGIVGYSVWPKLGYTGSIENLKIELGDRVRKAFPDARTVLDVNSTDKGRSWWAANGSTFEATFDLSEDSQSMKALAAYVLAKEKVSDGQRS